MSRLFSSLFIPIFMFLFLVTLYFHNASRDIYGGDVGDLVTAACVGGVPHPPGYPLFSFLGFSLCQLSHITPLSPALAVGLISIISAAGSVVLFFLIAQKAVSKSLALLASGVLAFSYLFWLYSEVAEVFALNIFFALLLFFLAQRFRESGKKGDFYLLALCMGLSLTNHQTIVLLFPSILLLIWKRLWEWRTQFLTLLSGVGFGLLGLSVYGWAIYASSTHPALDWAHITNIQSFMDMVLRKRYGTFSAGTFEPPSVLGTLVILKTYFISLISHITFPGFIFCLIGIDALLKKDKMLAYAYALAFLLSGPLFFGYAGFPLLNTFHAGVSERFLLLSTVMLLLFLPYGFNSLVKGFLRFFPRGIYSISLQIILAIIPLLLFIYNFPKTNLSSFTYGDTLGKNYLEILPKNSVVFMDGDTTLFNTWYVHLVKNYRPDVTVVNMYSLFDSTYFSEIQEQVKKEQPRISDQQIMMEVVKKIDGTRPVFSRVALKAPKDTVKWVPYGLVYELRLLSEASITRDEYKKQTDAVWGKITLPDIRKTTNLAAKNLTLSDIPTYYASSLLVTGNYFLTAYKDGNEAYRYYKKALEVDPENSRVYAVIGVYMSSTEKNCQKGEDYLKKALSLERSNSLFYYHLYSVYRLCMKDTEKTQQIIDDYYAVFHSSLESDLKKRLGSESDIKL